MNNNGIFLMTKKELRKAQFKAKVREFKAGVVKKVYDAARFFNENKEFVIFVGIPALTLATGLAKSGIQAATRTRRVHVANRNRNCRIYDPSARHYWMLKRELTPAEWVQVDRRRKKGERYADIFTEMRVLK